MAQPLLTVSGLKTYFRTPEGTARAVDGLSFHILPGETYALVGESGCGKSVTALSIMGLVPAPTGFAAGGSIHFKGQNLLALPEVEKRRVRGNLISMVFQEPMTSLNPVFTAGSQIKEALTLHQRHTQAQAREAAITLLRQVRIPDPERVYAGYPHQLSGGMRQRVMIAMALACRPELLIADEPTTALDVTIQDQILTLISELQQELGMAVLLITHNLGIVQEMADRVGVMYAGKMAEESSPEVLFREPKHPYTVKLLESLPAESKRGRALSTIPGSVPSATRYLPGCRFADRCPAVMRGCAETLPRELDIASGHRVACHLHDSEFQGVRKAAAEPDGVLAFLPVRLQAEPLIQAAGIKVHFPVTGGLLKRTTGYVKAVDGVDLAIPRGAVQALVGESGCGKTTFGKALLRLLPLTAGAVKFQGADLAQLAPSDLRPHRRQMQMIFQDPYSSLNPRLTVQEIVEEGILVHQLASTAKERERLVYEMLDTVGLDADTAGRYPHEFSGGQRQRIGIARALVVRPSFVVCDEATSALDVSVQAQILNLLKKLQGDFNLTYLFITHDLSLVEYFADLVSVMYQGQIVEAGTVQEVFTSPRHPYTRTLLASVPRVNIPSPPTTS